MNKTSLYDEHTKLNATMVDFHDWLMPIRYQSIKDEVKAVRESCGMFDVSHMGEFFFKGKDAIKTIDYLMTNDFLNSKEKRATYSPLCNDDGKIIDDAIGYKLTSEEALLCVNASNIEKDKNWIEKIIKEKNFDCSLKDSSDNYSLIAIQGPKSEKELETALGLPLSDIDYYEVKSFDDYILARTGYTGEDGFEVFSTHENIKSLWNKLIHQGVTPCGLAARDILRLEVAFPLYGQDLTDELTPYDCNLKWTVKMGKSDFSGKKFLEDYTPQKQLVKFILDQGIPRADHKIFQDDKEIGIVTSGTMSTTLNKGICLALVDKEKFNKEEVHFLEIRGKKYPANYTNKPFVSGGHK